MRSKKKDKVSGSDVHENMLEVEQSGEEGSTEGEAVLCGA